MWTEHSSMASYMQTWTIATSTQHTLYHFNIVYPNWRFTVHGNLSDISLWKFVVWVLESFNWRQRATLSSVFRFGMTTANEPKNGNCILPGSVSPGSDILRAGKWTQRHDWPTSLKCKSWLAVAQPQENAACWQTLSLPGHAHAQAWNDHIILFYLHFFGVMISSCM